MIRQSQINAQDKGGENRISYICQLAEVDEVAPVVT